MRKSIYKQKRVNGKCMKYHRWYYQNYYGIEISKDMVIHHIDFNSLNNNIENLQMMSRKEHTKLHNSKNKSDEQIKLEIKERSRIYYEKNRDII